MFSISSLISRALALTLLAMGLLLTFNGAALGQDGGRAAQGAVSGSAFRYQGQLDNNGVLVNGDCDFRFNLWNSGGPGGSSVGSPVELLAVPVSEGRFTVPLDFGASFPPGQERWLEIEVKCPAGGGSYSSLGLQQITATPYALTASNADTLDGYHASNIQTSHNHAGQDWPTVNTTYGLRVDNSGTYGLFAAGGSYGVYGSGSNYGLFGASASAIGVYGDGGDGLGDYGGYFTGYSGVYGSAENAAGQGVYGSNIGAGYGVYAVSNAGDAVYGDGGSGFGDYGGNFTGYNGVFGNAENSAGHGVYGHNSGTGNGVFGESVGGNGVRGIGGPAVQNYGGSFTGGSGIYAAGAVTSTGRAMLAYSNAETFGAGTISAYNTASAGSPTGIFVDTQAGDDNAAYGVVADSDYVGLHGRAFRTGTFHAGVWGYVTDSAGYGLYSTGAIFGSTDLEVVGNISKGGGSFKIDHPQDPENKYLYHSFVESPDMMNIYNGNVILDEHGAAWVELPGYFEALNMDFRYQLTAIGAPGPNLYVASKIEGNRFQIGGGAPGMEVSWQVTGIRNDPYAQANRIPVEEAKPGNERGSYLHPQAYGQPVERGLTAWTTPEVPEAAPPPPQPDRP